jgi:hypothetical protein
MNRWLNGRIPKSSMKILTVLCSVLLVCRLSHAETTSAIAEFDQLRSRLVSILGGENSNREHEAIIRKLTSVAYEDLMLQGQVFTKGMDSRWAERLESLPSGPLEGVLRDKDVSEFTKSVEVFGDEAIPPLGAHLLQRCYIFRALAVYFARNEKLDKSESFVLSSTGYLDLIDQFLADKTSELKLEDFILENRLQNQKFLTAVKEERRKNLQEMAQSQPRQTQGQNSAATEGSGELDRFKAHWKGRTETFTVTDDDGGSLLNGTFLEVQDRGTGKKFVVHYNSGLSGIFDDDVRSAIGSTVSIRFGEDGLPASITNPSNGRGTQTGSGWKIKGYGW